MAAVVKRTHLLDTSEVVLRTKFIFIQQMDLTRLEWVNDIFHKYENKENLSFGQV